MFCAQQELAVAENGATWGCGKCQEGVTACKAGRPRLRLAFCGSCTDAGLVPPHAQVLLLDELTTFLDYEDQENVLQCVRAIVDSSRQPGGEQQAAAAAGGMAQRRQQRQQGGGLDPSLVLQQEGEWQEQQRGVTALWVTHRLEELEYADSVR